MTDIAPAAEEQFPAVGSGNVVDDMHDSLAVRDAVAASPPLRGALLQVDEVLLSRFEEHDHLATSAQRRFRFVIFVTAGGGALAVLGAVVQLACVALDLHTAAHLAEKFQALLIVLTIIGVLTGIRLAQIENWLLDRFKAEQLRLLKFRMLLDPRIWGGAVDRETWRAELVQQRDQIVRVTQQTLAHESERDEMPRLPTPADCAAIDHDGLRALLEYYRHTRIESQVRHFAAATRRGISLLDQPRLLPWVFFLSILMVGGHVVIEQTLQRVPEVFGTSGWRWEQASILLVAIAVALPVIWAGIRAWRSTRESTRTVARSAARRRMLADIVPMLDQLQGADAAHALCQLQMLELLLESDQREWLRLMREVEWYSYS